MSEGRLDQEANSIDWISNLPDSILTHILSFLSTQQAVQTCILSKRWRSLWASVPSLHFDFDDFLTDNSYLHEEYTRCEVRFHQFVNHVWQNRKVPQLDSFKLFMENIKEDTDHSDATAWILQAIQCNPRALSVNLCRLGSFYVPDSVFTCASLELLQLSYVAFMRSKSVKPKMVSLPSLKIVHLESVTVDALLLEELLSGCPAIETLKLHYCHLVFSKISSNSLKNLVITKCTQSARRVVIEISSLESLFLFENVDKFALHNTCHLVDTEMWGFNYAFYRSKMLDGLANVTTLLLEGTPMYEDIKVKEGAMTNFPIFNNLRDLCIGGWCVVSDFDLVASFLKNSPNLQNLTFYVKIQQSGYKHLRRAETMPEGYLREHLKMVEIRRLTDSGSVDPLVKTLEACVKNIGIILAFQHYYNW